MILSRHWSFYVVPRWSWPSVVFRFNGGGYMYGAQPYKEWALGPFRLRRWI